MTYPAPVRLGYVGAGRFAMFLADAVTGLPSVEIGRSPTSTAPLRTGSPAVGSRNV
jgi:hypothetical protein